MNNNISIKSAIKKARTKIKRAKKESLNRLQFVTECITVEVDSDTLLLIDIETNDYYNYQKLELLSVDLIRNDKVFDNISESIAAWLQSQIDDMNTEKYRDYIYSESKSGFETSGDIFCGV